MNKKDVKPPRVILGKSSNSLKMGIVGFPNVGKSSTFNLLSDLHVKAENYPFCTIDPHMARVPVHDARYNKLCDIFNPKSKVPAHLTIYDIAGLIPNAHKGEGLGNNFLSTIQQVDGIYHMVRAFEDVEIIHTEGDIDPIRDMNVISNELIQKDLEIVGNRITEAEAKIKRNSTEQLKREVETLKKVTELLEKGVWVKDNDWTPVEIEILNGHFLFTAKPVVYLINICNENFVSKKNKWLPKIKEWITTRCPGKMIPFSVDFEQKLKEGTVQGESAVDKIINTGYEELQLIHFFTAGEDEVKCWTIRKGSLAPRAAGTIHTDFEKGFICAEVMSYSDFIEFGGELGVKNAGKYKQNGKLYEVQDGDIIFFKFNPPKK